MAVQENMFGSGEVFSYLECISCQSLQIYEIPKDLYRFYPSNYYSMNYDKHASLSIFKKLRAFAVRAYTNFYLAAPSQLISQMPQPKRGDLRAFLKLRAPKSKKILDVGCGGSPALLDLLASVGYRNLTGLDPFIQESKHFENGVRLIKGDLARIGETFDIILMNHSIEHTINPQDELKNLSMALSLDGRAVIRTPTPSSEAYQKYGSSWAQLDAPRHLNLPSRAALRSMIDAAELYLFDQYDDSDEFQFFGSELYSMGKSLSAENIASNFTSVEMARFHREAVALNKKSFGDQVVCIVGHKQASL